MKLIFIALLTLYFTNIFGQSYFIGPNSPIDFELIDNTSNTLPLEFRIYDVVNDTKIKSVELKIDFDRSLNDSIYRMEQSDFSHIVIRKQVFHLSEIPFNENSIYDDKNLAYFNEKKLTFYLDILPSFPVPITEKRLKLMLSINGEPNKWYTVILKPERLSTFSSKEYHSNNNIKLDRVYDAVPHQDKFMVYGERFAKDARIFVLPDRKGRFSVTQSFSPANSPGSELITIMTNSVRVRPSITVNESSLEAIDYPSRTSIGFRNIGINLNLYELRKDIYNLRGRQSSHSFGIGIMALVGFEQIQSSEFEPEASNPVSREVFSTSFGLTVNFRFNEISFIAIPIGIDVSGNSALNGWVYKNQPWFGFGLGYCPVFLR